MTALTYLTLEDLADRVFAAKITAASVRKHKLAGLYARGFPHPILPGLWDPLQVREWQDAVAGRLVAPPHRAPRPRDTHRALVASRTAALGDRP